MAAAGHRLRSTLREAASAATDCAAFRHVVLEELRTWVPFEAGCFATTEPATLLPTSLLTVGYDGPAVYAAVLDIEYGPNEEPGRFDTMRRRPVPVRTLREATGDHPRGSRYYADILAPHGLSEEVRMIFRTKDGLPWGACTLARSGRGFSSDELALLGGVLADVGEGIRATIFRASVHAAAAGAGVQAGPALAVVGPDLELESVTEAAADYLARLGWGREGRAQPALPARAMATWLRTTGGECLTLRSRTRDGEWVVIRAGWLGHSLEGRVAVTFERAQAMDLFALAAAAHGLTRRETEVLEHLIANETRAEIAASLSLSPHTVHDHLKSIYAKTGTSGRGSLMTSLLHTEVLPRLGAPLSPDGWFSG